MKATSVPIVILPSMIILPPYRNTSAVETVAPLLAERRHRLEIAVPTTGLAVLADPERLLTACEAFRRALLSARIRAF